jgi:tripartite-type tricarboxylate transporter receptor subunit TctC
MAFASDIPTIAESGYPGFEAVGWFGLVTPARTPKTIIDRLNTEVVMVAHIPEVRDRLTAMGFDVVTSTPEAFARHIESEVMLWRNLAKPMGLRAK